MTEAQTLPGFDNILAQQEGSRLYLTHEHPDGTRGATGVTVIDRNDYDSEQEFMIECVLWARRNGGVEVK